MCRQCLQLYLCLSALEVVHLYSVESSLARLQDYKGLQVIQKHLADIETQSSTHPRVSLNSGKG